MKALLQKMAAYNLWANSRIIACIQQQDENLCYQQTASSFDSLYKTIVHIWDAESGWWQRIKLQERIVPPSQNFKPSLTEACHGLLQQSTQYADWVKAASDLALLLVFQYTNFRKDQYKQPVYEVLVHVFSHSTFHRGQMVTMLRQIGITNHLPPTDFSFYCQGQK